MDLTQLLGALVSNDAVSGISQSTETSAADVTNVLAAALPALLAGAQQQAEQKETNESFTNALMKHGEKDTNNILSFLSGVDAEDGGKIVGHLLGANTQSTEEAVAKKTGVSTKNIAKILAVAAPLLMSLLGNQAKQNKKQEATSGDLATALMTSLLSGGDSADVLSALLGVSTGKKKKKSDNLLGSLLGSLLGGNK